MSIPLKSEQFLTRFYQCPNIALKLAAAVDVYVNANSDEKLRAEEILVNTYEEISKTPTRTLRKGKT